MRRAALVALALAALAAPSGRASLQSAPPDHGSTALGLALRRLGVTGRVLYVTAHPDDEHNGVLVRLSRGLGIRTALLTLTRGEGGQNEIGPELFDALGVLRTEELMTVHRYDGVEQYFGRAWEFGYSFSVEETFDRWGREATLGDVVRVIRAFRPDVVLTLSLESPGGGQHHQAAARLAVAAFRAAADPARFPEQLRQGLRPWQARKVYQGGVGGGDQPAAAGARPLTLSTSVFDALLGMSWQELGSIARGAHRSQGTSQLKAAPAEGSGAFLLVDSEPQVVAPEGDIMDGVDLSLSGLRRFARDDDVRLPDLEEELAGVQAQVEAAQASYEPRLPDRSVGPLASALTALRALRDKVAASGARADLVERLDDEEKDLAAALALAQSLLLEAVSDDAQVVRGQAFGVSVTVANQGLQPAVLDEVVVQAPPGWTVERQEGSPGALAPGRAVRLRYAVTVGPEARWSQPYWRREPGADRLALEVPAHETLPWSPPDLVAVARHRAGDVASALEQPVVWRYEGPWVGGEKRKVLQVAPALSVRLAPALTVVPLAAPRAREFRVAVVNNAREPGEARVRLQAPAGWRIEPTDAPLQFRFEGEEQTARFLVTPPARLQPGETTLRAVARRGGSEFADGVQAIAYDHVHERPLLRPASARVRAFDVAIAPGVSVGYVMGAGDEVADALRQLGFNVTLLAPEDLAFSDLARYTTIVTGIRAYQTRPDLRAHHQRLMDWVRAGGHLVVQYNKFEFNQLVEPPRVGGMIYSRPARGDSPFAPYPAAVSSARISDETAPVKVLAPEHPVLRQPNRIGPGDWDGWVQERGLYFLEARDPRYTELVAMSDPFPNNPGEKKGALVEAAVGRGTWTYVALGLFRQVPAGTPGAWRLLANLVSRPRG